MQLSINQTREEINKKLDSYKQLEKSLENKDIIEDYLQQMATAKTILSFYKQDLSAYDIKIKEYEEQLPKKPDIKLLLNVALQCIKNDMQKYKPSFSEFRYITQFDTQNLTVKISNDLDKDDFYLWETGSGSNWVAYHLAALLGFHRYFIDNKCPVFNFIIFDQPTQVYFPTAKYDAKNKLYTFNEDSSDYKNVQEMYAYMDKAVQDCNGHLQILVLDHTDESIWKKFQTVNEVADWSNREKDALIPNSW